MFDQGRVFTSQQQQCNSYNSDNNDISNNKLLKKRYKRENCQGVEENSVAGGGSLSGNVGVCQLPLLPTWRRTACMEHVTCRLMHEESLVVRGQI